MYDNEQHTAVATMSMNVGIVRVTDAPLLKSCFSRCKQTMMTAHQGQSADPRPIRSNTEEKTHTAIYNSESAIDSALVESACELLLFFTSLSTLSSLPRLFLAACFRILFFLPSSFSLCFLSSSSVFFFSLFFSATASHKRFCCLLRPDSPLAASSTDASAWCGDVMRVGSGGHGVIISADRVSQLSVNDGV